PQLWFVDANNDGLNDLMRLLGLPSGNYHDSLTAGINASGQICGTARYSYAFPPQNATVWSASGTATNVGGGTGNTITMGPGINVDQINNSGIVAGTSPTSSHATLWLPPGLGATYGLSDGLNDLDPASSWASSEAVALNNAAPGAPLQVIGVATDASGNQTG